MKTINNFLLLFLFAVCTIGQIAYSADGSNHTKQSALHYISSLLATGCGLSTKIAPLKKFCGATAVVTLGSGTVHAIDAINDSNLNKKTPEEMHNIQVISQASKL